MDQESLLRAEKAHEMFERMRQLDECVDLVDKKYTKVAGLVDGRVVREGVPNRSSISASLNEFQILPGIREVSLSEFASSPRDLFYAKNDFDHVEKLASDIKASGEISPLIVIIDSEGPYILEGAHRLGALHILGAATFPALVVVDGEMELKKSHAIGLN